MNANRAQATRSLYPIMLITGIAVTVFSLLGIAAITGHLPVARSDPAPLDSGQPRTKPAPAVCSQCGVVTSIRVVESEGRATGLGAVAGGVTGALVGNQIGDGHGRTAMTVVGAAGGAYMGNEIEKRTRARTSYVVTLRMDDGTRRTLYLGHMPATAVGERVKIRNGVPVALN